MRRFWLTILITLLPLAVSAETMQRDQRYQGPKTLELPGLSTSFELPSGYVAALPTGSDFVTIGKDDELGRVFVWAAEIPQQQLVATMSQPIDIMGALMLMPRGAPTASGNQVTGNYQATDGMSQFSAKIYATAGKNGLSVAFIAVAPPDTFSKYDGLARKMNGTLKFKKRAAKTAKPAAGQKSANSGPWAQRLGNVQYIRYAHGSGYSEKEIYHLCGNGRFYHHFNAGSTGITGNAGMNDNARGRWSIQGSQLTLTFDNGNTTRAAIAEQGGSFYVNGTKWYRKPMPCQ